MDRTIFPNNNNQTDKSVLSGSNSTNAEYINECIKEVCVNEDSLSKFKKQIEKQYPANGFYEKCEKFVSEVNESVQRKKFTNISIKNMEYLGKDILLDGSTIANIIQHFEKIFKDEENKELDRQRKENERKAEEKRKKEEDADMARREEQRRLDQIKQEQQKKQNVILVRQTGIVALFITSIITIFSKDIVVGVISFPITYLLLYILDRRK